MANEPLFIRDVPTSERPRERLLTVGASQLSNQELLAILIRTGTKKMSAIELAQKVLQKFDGLTLLRDATIEEFQTIKGIGIVKAIELAAAIELGKRIHSLKREEQFIIRSPEDVANFVMDEMRFLQQEHFVCLFLNSKNRILHKETIFIGSLNVSVVHPREIYKEAFRRSAASIICLHNHPSGVPEPSKEDIEVTKRLVECSKLLGIELLDHLIIGDRTYVSLKERGYI